jgi:oligosaccharide repeat unit polymerase
MSDIAFIIFWLFLPLFGCIVLRLVKIEFFRISIPTVLLYSILVFQYLGFPILYFGLDEFRAEYVTNKIIVWQMLAFTSLTTLLLVIGFIVGKRLFGSLSPPKLMVLPNGSNSLEVAVGKYEQFVILVLFMMGFVVLLAYINSVGMQNLALYSALSLGSETSGVEQLRSMMGNDFQGNYHWYKLFMRDLLNMASFSLYALYLLRPTRLRLLIVLISLSISILSSLLASEKAPVLWFVIGLVFVYLLVLREGRISIFHMVLFAPILMMLAAFAYIFFMGADGFDSGLQRAYSRILAGQMQGLYHYIEIFPQKINFLYGSSFPNPAGLLPHTPFELTTEVMNIVMPQLAQRGVTGSMPTFFWGELYANFGVFGVVAIPLFVGLYLHVVNFFILQLKFSPILIGFYVWCMLHFMNLSSTNLSSYVIDIYFIPIALISLAALSVSYKGILRKRRFYGR